MSDTHQSRLGRRRFLQAAVGVGVLGAADAFGLEPRWLDVSDRTLSVPGLSHALDGMRIAHITDAHLTSLGSVEQAIVDVVRRGGVRLVVLTGDIVDDAKRLPLLGEWISGLRAAGADCVGSFGNWEHWAGFTPVALAEEYRRFGGRLLVNEATELGGVVVAATDDGYVGAPRFDLTFGALGGLGGDGVAKLLLSHSPGLLDHAPADPIHFDLTLSGHTHGGQIRVGSFAPLIPPGSGRFVAGEYDTPLGRAYVSRGTGTSLIPARFTCRPELPIFRLERA